jgi:hypothetical protein
MLQQPITEKTLFYGDIWIVYGSTFPMGALTLFALTRLLLTAALRGKLWALLVVSQHKAVT